VLPLAARAQQSGVPKHVAVLAGNADNPTTRTYIDAFRKGLAEAGWHEGRNINIDVRWGNGDAARITAKAAELVGLAPDAILATNTPTVRAFRQANESIPIVFAGLSDPIGDGFVSSLSRPGGNITGFTSFNAPIAGKWLEILKELSPSAQHAGVIFNPTTAPHSIFLPVMEVIASQTGCHGYAAAGDRSGNDRGCDRQASGRTEFRSRRLARHFSQPQLRSGVSAGD
jgi:putative ABC transport system substrate-binding protein